MADDGTTTPGGPPAPGWWMASDGRWYPPEPADPAADTPTKHDEDRDDGPTPDRKPLVLVGIGVLALIVLVVGILQVTGGDDGGDLSMDEVLERTEDSDLSDRTTTTGDPLRTEMEAEPGYTLNTPEYIGVKLDDLDAAQLLGVDYRFTVEATGLVDRIDLQDQRLVPADGETFLVVRYELTTLPSRPAPAGSIDVDGVKRTVALKPGTNTLVKAVDAKADDLGLNLVDRDTSQTISMTTGKIVGERPEILYRRDRRIAVNNSMALTYTIPDSTTNRCKGGQGVAELTLGGAELVWSGADSPIYTSKQQAENLTHPAEGDLAWLVVEVNDYRAAGPDSCTYQPEIPAERIVLVTDDGVEVASRWALVRGVPYLLFAVTADLAQATIEVRPGDGVLDERAPGAVYSFGGSTGQIPVVFSSGAGRTTTTAGE